jgi:hypothetical protein
VGAPGGSDAGGGSAWAAAAVVLLVGLGFYLTYEMLDATGRLDAWRYKRRIKRRGW